MSDDTRIEKGDLVCLVGLCCQRMRNRYCGWVGTALEIYEDHSAIIGCREGALLFSHFRFVGIEPFAIPVPETWLQKLRPGKQKNIDEMTKEAIDELIAEFEKHGYKVEVM